MFYIFHEKKCCAVATTPDKQYRPITTIKYIVHYHSSFQKKSAFIFFPVTTVFYYAVLLIQKHCTIFPLTTVAIAPCLSIFHSIILKNSKLLNVTYYYFISRKHC
jgi:hypothetical protein